MPHLCHKKSTLRTISLGLLTLVIGSLIMVLSVATWDIARHPHWARQPYDEKEIKRSTLTLTESSLINDRDEKLYAWYIPNASPASPTSAGALANTTSQRGQYCLLIQHGYKSDRSEVLRQAKIFYDAGYSLLIPAMRAHDTSEGTAIHFGLQEGQDIHLWVTYLKNTLNYDASKIGLIGVSLGGTALLYAHAQYGDGAVIVLQSTFASLEEVIETGITYFTGLPGKVFGWPISHLVALVNGFSRKEITPLQWATTIKIPVFLMQGGEDKVIPRTSGRQLYAALGTPFDKKILWFEPEQKHAEFEYDHEEAFTMRVLEFLNKFLITPSD